VSRIRILPENLANQIAAGEVIERPASVVKELVENAIDAGAVTVSVQVEGNGTRLIRVIDDGHGMDQDDVLLCLERHATSKVASLEELGAIRSLGFRGEAVPSIASVSRLRITSRPETDALGTQADIRFGRLLKVHEMGCGPGTSFEVSDLFGNVPARRKFLKSTRTELAHIEEILRSCALARPALGVNYSVDGREVLRLPAGVDSDRSRIGRVLVRSEETLIELRPDLQPGAILPGSVLVSGCLLPPDGPAAARLRVFVNGRAIQDRMLAHAVAEGMQNYLMKGRRPAGALFLQVAPESVDVNVHPTKQEVRFHRPEALHQAVVVAVRAAMAARQQSLRREIFAVPAGGQSRVAGPVTVTPVLREAMPLFRPTADFAAPVGNASRAGREEGQSLHPSSSAGTGRNLTGEQGPESFPSSCPAPEADEGQVRGLRYLGQVLCTYLLCESEDGLLVIDQHAAHERLLFELLKKQFAARKIARQALLFPRIVECAPDEISILQRCAGEISALGLDIEDFGGGSYAIKAVPVLLARAPAEEVLAGILGRFSRNTSVAAGARAEDVLADMACKAAVKAGQPLSGPEAEALIADMLRAEIFSHCPHGRPVARRFCSQELKRWFYRG
jgi:DNA mismatch repair protein MutL